MTRPARGGHRAIPSAPVLPDQDHGAIAGEAEGIGAVRLARRRLRWRPARRMPGHHPVAAIGGHQLFLAVRRDPAEHRYRAG
jgi:hypothetical protein